MIIIIKKWKEDDEYFEVQYDTETNKYYSCFKDVKRKNQRVEIREDIVQAYIEASKVARKFENEYSRHIEHSEIYDNNLNDRALDKPISLEDEVIRKATFDDVRNAIETLSDIQKRRIKLYYFEGKTQEEIAEIEKVNIRNVQSTLKDALYNLKKIIKK